ncbi:hypothetical protein F2Q70_00018509 [Brassica cretica]|uniref:Uncharacterized protein n=1 Tax=Brassica cretica TaxID=69181 RepID=A0A8S9I0W1_BRACR|nr:hypothetical protein F2Q70_00018509 [Brassica cretica]
MDALSWLVKLIDRSLDNGVASQSLPELLVAWPPPSSFLLYNGGLFVERFYLCRTLHAGELLLDLTVSLVQSTEFPSGE